MKTQTIPLTTKVALNLKFPRCVPTKGIGFFCLLFLLLNTISCYEGWEDPSATGQGQTGSLPTSPEPSGSSPKPYVYILFTPIRLDAAAMANTQCFPSQDLKDYKNAEWSERISSISASLSEVTEKLVIKNLNITSGDCASLGMIQNEALKATPWLPEGAPQGDPANRLTLHLKAVFWQGDPALTPPSQVAREDWQGVSDLKVKGIRSKSATYHVVSGGGAGYHNIWAKALPKNGFKSGSPINQIDPSTAGVANRSQHIKKETAELIIWLRESFQ